MTFKEELNGSFIPSINKMLFKERRHLLSLLITKQKLAKRGYYLYVEEINIMIRRSKEMVMHFQKRLIEYTNYEKTL